MKQKIMALTLAAVLALCNTTPTAEVQAQNYASTAQAQLPENTVNSTQGEEIVITEVTGDPVSTIYPGASLEFDESRIVYLDYLHQVTLKVTATGGSGDLSYQWYDYQFDINDAVPSTTGNTHTVTGNGEVNNCYCRITDGITSKTVGYQITVITGISASSNNGEPYGIHPNRQRVIKTANGKTVELTVEASSQTGNLTYAWYRTDHDYDDILDCDANKYSVTAEEKESIYRCVVSDDLHYQTVYFVILSDIDYHWDKAAETLTISGTGCIPSNIFLYSGCREEEEYMNDFTNLKIIVKDGVTGIDDYALIIDRKSDIKYPYDVTIPASVKEIGTKAVGFELYSYDTPSNEDATKSSACTIHGYKDTAAQKYAADNNLTFQLLRESENRTTSLNSCQINFPSQAMAYTGKAITPKLTITHGSKTLNEGIDYTISYDNNVNIGTATITITGKGSYTGTVTKSFAITALKGSTHIVGAYKYTVTRSSEVAFAGLKNSKTTRISIPKTAKIGGKNFKVTSIAKNALKKSKMKTITIGANVNSIGNNAFENCSNLTKVTIGTGVTKIGSNAFKNCKNLGTLTVKSSKLKTVGKNAFKGIKSNAKIKVPAKKMNQYKKLLKGKGQGQKIKITK